MPASWDEADAVHCASARQLADDDRRRARRLHWMSHFGGEITYVTRGSGPHRAAAIVPAELVERYEAMVDAEDGRIATERLADLEAGHTIAIPADEVARTLGL